MKIFKLILILINIVITIPLFAIVFGIYPSPETSRIAALLPAFFIGAALLNIAFIIVWIIVSRRYIIISLLALLVSAKFIFAIFPVPSYLSIGSRDADFTIMTYNVMLFGFYDWENNREIKNNILELIFYENPDIMCFQEVYWNNRNDNFSPLPRLMKKFPDHEIHKGAMATARQGQHFGLATVSKYPIVNKEILKFEKSFNGVIITDVLINEDTVRIFNCHLQSIQLEQKDYTVIETLSEDIDNYGVRLILRKIIEATKKRAGQADIVAQKIRESPYPVFVCGDLNDFPLSYTYLTLSSGLKDSYSAKGNFPGHTWDNFGIKQRIDVVFYDRSFRCTDHIVIRESLSDHFPVITGFSKK